MEVKDPCKWYKLDEHKTYSCWNAHISPIFAWFILILLKDLYVNTKCRKTYGTREPYLLHIGVRGV